MRKIQINKKYAHTYDATLLVRVSNEIHFFYNDTYVVLLLFLYFFFFNLSPCTFIIHLSCIFTSLQKINSLKFVIDKNDTTTNTQSF